MTLPIGQKETKRKGFSLIELLLVTAISMILLGLVIPQVTGSLSRLEIKDTSRDITALIRYAQAKSITEQTGYRLNMDLGRNSYWLTYQKKPGDNYYQRLKTSIGRIYYLAQGINIDSLSFENSDLAGQSYLTFYPDGAIDKAVIKLSNKIDNFSISVTGRIGQVIIEEEPGE